MYVRMYVCMYVCLYVCMDIEAVQTVCTVCVLPELIPMVLTAFHYYSTVTNMAAALGRVSPFPLGVLYVFLAHGTVICVECGPHFCCSVCYRLGTIHLISLMPMY